MQFHSNLAIATGYNIGDYYLSNLISIAVYSGDQPTASEYATNFSSNYTWGSGNQLLAIYGVINSDAVYDNETVNIATSPSTGVAQLSEPSNSYTITRKAQAGTASWAVIFTSVDARDKVYNGGSLSDSADYFLIVPVTDLTGNGVIKFSTVEFNSSTSYPIQNFNLTPSVV